MAAAATAPARAAQPPWRITTEADDIMGQVPPEGMNIALRFAGLPREEIVCIVRDTFKPINLYWLVIFEDFGLTPTRARNKSGLRMAMLRPWQTLGHTSNSESFPTRSGRRPFTTTPPFVSRCL